MSSKEHEWLTSRMLYPLIHSRFVRHLSAAYLTLPAPLPSCDCDDHATGDLPGRGTIGASTRQLLRSPSRSRKRLCLKGVCSGLPSPSRQTPPLAKASRTPRKISFRNSSRWRWGPQGRGRRAPCSCFDYQAANRTPFGSPHPRSPPPNTQSHDPHFP